MRIIRRVLFVIGVWLTVELVAWAVFSALGQAMFQTRYVGIGQFMPTPTMMGTGPVLLLVTWRKTWPEVQRFIDSTF
ncbi:MAG TPA: hypothetical protein PKG74_00755 [Candidatus Colwellbacteria bacterium]|nr:hypothetical protein [Candidatus Colwellbacteria bacterium]